MNRHFPSLEKRAPILLLPLLSLSISGYAQTGRLTGSVRDAKGEHAIGATVVVKGTGNGAIEKLPDWYMQGQPKPKDGRVTLTTWKHYNKDSPLLESGLLGPVRLLNAVVHGHSS